MNTTDQETFAEFVRLLLQARDERAMTELLEALLTPSELHDIPNRLKIIRLLRGGMTQREVASTLGVGIATVTRGSKAMAKFDKLLDDQPGTKTNE